MLYRLWHLLFIIWEVPFIVDFYAVFFGWEEDLGYAILAVHILGAVLFLWIVYVWYWLTKKRDEKSGDVNFSEEEYNQSLYMGAFLVYQYSHLAWMAFNPSQVLWVHRGESFLIFNSALQVAFTMAVSGDDVDYLFFVKKNLY